MYKEMDAPCPCQNCGEWFDLHDGYGSEKWFPNTVICEQCHLIEEKEIEKDEEIEEQVNALEDAVWTVNESLVELEKLGSEQVVYIARSHFGGSYRNKRHEEAIELIKRMANVLVFNKDCYLKKLNDELDKINTKYPKMTALNLYTVADIDPEPRFYPKLGESYNAGGYLIRLEPIRLR